MSRDDDYYSRHDEQRFYDDRRDRIRRRFEENRRGTRSIIEGSRTGDFSKAYRELDIAPAASQPPNRFANPLPSVPNSLESGSTDASFDIPPLDQLEEVRISVDGMLGVTKKTLKMAGKAAARQSESQIAVRFAELIRRLTALHRKSVDLSLYKDVYAESLGKPITLSEQLAGGRDFTEVDPLFERVYQERKREIAESIGPLEEQLHMVIEDLFDGDPARQSR